MAYIENIFVRRGLVDWLCIEKRQTPGTPQELRDYLYIKGVRDVDMEIFTSSGMNMAADSGDPIYRERYRKLREDQDYVMFVAEYGN